MFSNVGSLGAFMGGQNIVTGTSLQQDANTAAINVNHASQDYFSIDESLDKYKAHSLTYQLLKAIANQATELSQEPANDVHSHAFEINLSETFEFEAEVATDNFKIEFEVNFEWEWSQQLSRISSIQQSQNFRFTVTNQTQVELEIDIPQDEPTQADPLILNLDNTDFNFSSHLVDFDLNADGKLDKINQLETGNSYLAIDSNANGLIDDGRELFGDALGSQDGFIELAKYDNNRDGMIDANDRVFQHLLLLNFTDNNEQKLVKLASTDIQSISLNKSQTEEYYADNLLVSASQFIRQDGTLGQVGDFLLKLN